MAIVVKTRTLPGKRDEVHRLWEAELKPRLEETEGQSVYVWVDDGQDPDVFVLFEIYTDPAVFQRNAAAPWFGAYMGKVGPLLAGEPEVTMGAPRYTKGVS